MLDDTIFDTNFLCKFIGFYSYLWIDFWIKKNDYMLNTYFTRHMFKSHTNNIIPPPKNQNKIKQKPK